MSTYKHFAVVGYGFIASKLVPALLQKKGEGPIDSVIVVSRSEKAHEELTTQGCELRTVTGYTDAASLETALRGTDVVISTMSTVSDDALAAHATVARAAAAAGAQLFVPSDFGSSLDGHTKGIYGAKNEVKIILRELDLPFASFYNGALVDRYFSPKRAALFGFDFVNGKFDLPGNGKAENSYTASEDVARFVAHVLTALPKEALEWHTFRIEGERTSWNNIITSWAKRTGKSVEVTHRPIEETKAKLAENPKDFVSFVICIIDSGVATVGKPEELSNALWPEWKPANIVDTLVRIYDQ